MGISTSCIYAYGFILNDVQANSGRVIIAHTNYFTVVCLVTWPLNESEAGGNLALIETSLLLLC